MICTEIKCYGTGCEHMTIYTIGHTSAISMSINACGSCSDILGDCLEGISLYCGYSNGGYSIAEYYPTGGAPEDRGFCSNYWHTGSCGCSDFIESIKTSNDADDSECYGNIPSLRSAYIAGILNVFINWWMSSP